MVSDQVPARRTALRSPAKLVAANSGWQLVTFAARAVSGLGVVVLVARSGGPRGLGVFQFALMLTAMLPFYYGVPPLLAREVARRPEDGRRWVEAGTLIALLAGGFFAALLVGGSILVSAEPETVVAIQIAAVGMALDGVARVQFAAFWAWERMHLEALVTSVQEAVFLVAAAAALSAGGGAREALIAFTASRGVGAVVGWAYVGRRLGAPVVPRADLPFLRSTLRRCTPFAVNDTLTLTYMRADTVMLGMFRGPVAVGLYQAGTNLVLYFNVIARSINHALYPRMSKAWPGRPRDFQRLRDASLRAIGLIAIPVTVASLLLAPRTFDLLYGPKFAEAVLAYQLLVLVIPVRMIGHTFSLALAAADRQARRTVAVTAVAVLNVGLNCYAIPTWSYLGAAVTTLACESLLLVLYALILRQAAGDARVPHTLAVPAAAAVPMAAAILVTGSQHLIVSLVAGCAAYCLTVLGLALLRGPRQPPKAALAGLVVSDAT